MAQDVVTPDLRIRKLPELPVGAVHGYHEVVFEITNSSPDRAHEVRLDLPDSNQGYGGTHVLRRMTHSAVVGPSSTVRLALHQPPLPLIGFSVRVTVDGRVLRDRLSVNSGHPSDTHVAVRSSGSTEAALRVLVSQRVRTEAFPQDPDPERYLRATTPVQAWSGNWLAYSGYDGVVLEAGELEGLDAAVASALARYVETGGSLLVTGTARSAVLPELERRPSSDEEGPEVAYAGFGVLLTSPEGVETLTAKEVDRVVRSWFRTREPWSLLRDPAAAHRILTVNPDVRVPVRGIFLVVVGFTILIGPVNLLVLTRRRKRIWMLWTVPVAALVTSAVVFLYAILSEGLIRIERSASLTVLDERSHRAVTLGWAGYYSTLTPGSGLFFDRGTEVSPITGWSWTGGGGTRTVDWREGQHLASGWISARLPAHFMVRKSELRRERLAFRFDGGAPLVTNGLGEEIRALYLADADGRVYTSVSKLAAGASGRLERLASASPAGAPPAVLRDLYRSEFPKDLEKVAKTPGSYLRPGTYLAFLDEHPFLERGVRGAREVRAEAVVYGLLAGKGAP